MEDLRWRREAERAIDALTESFFAAFSFDESTRPNYEGLRNLFIAPGVLVNAAGTQVQTEGVDAFIASRRAIYQAGMLTQYRIAATSGATELFGSVAQRSSIFVRSGTRCGHYFESRGAIFFLYVKVDDRWRIIVAAWDDHKSGRPLSTTRVVDEFG